MEIAWKQIQEEHGQQRYAPMVKTSPLFVEENFGPNTANDASAQEIIDLPYQLSHLKILSSTTTRPSPQTFPITILAAFVVTTPPLPLGLDHIQPSSSSGTNYTVLTFFEIQRKTLGLSIGFDKFSTKSKSTNSVQTRVRAVKLYFGVLNADTNSGIQAPRSAKQRRNANCSAIH